MLFRTSVSIWIVCVSMTLGAPSLFAKNAALKNVKKRSGQAEKLFPLRFSVAHQKAPLLLKLNGTLHTRYQKGSISKKIVKKQRPFSLTLFCYRAGNGFQCGRVEQQKWSYLGQMSKQGELQLRYVQCMPYTSQGARRFLFKGKVQGNRFQIAIRRKGYPSLRQSWTGEVQWSKMHQSKKGIGKR